MQYEAFARTDLGKVRENNEDSMLVDVDNGIFIVADGMGGHASGDVASRIAADEMVAFIAETQDAAPDVLCLQEIKQVEDSFPREALAALCGAAAATRCSQRAVIRRRAAAS